MIMGSCEFCSKIINSVDNNFLIDNPDKAVCMYLEGNEPIIYGSYGSVAFDYGMACFIDTNMKDFFVDKLRTRDELYICDDCLEQHRNKYIKCCDHEQIDFCSLIKPENHHYVKEIVDNLFPVPFKRQCLYFTYNDIHNLKEVVENINFDVYIEKQDSNYIVTLNSNRYNVYEDNILLIYKTSEAVVVTQQRALELYSFS